MTIQKSKGFIVTITLEDSAMFDVFTDYEPSLKDETIRFTLPIDKDDVLFHEIKTKHINNIKVRFVK